MVSLVRAVGGQERRALPIARSVVELIAGIVIVSSPGIGIGTLDPRRPVFIARGVVLLATAWIADRLRVQPLPRRVTLAAAGAGLVHSIVRRGRLGDRPDFTAPPGSRKRGLPAFLPSTTARLRGVGLR